MNDHIAVRLKAEDRDNLLTIARALEAQDGPGTMPWIRGATMTRCLRVGLRVAAEEARRGTLIGKSERTADAVGTAPTGRAESVT